MRASSIPRLAACAVLLHAAAIGAALAAPAATTRYVALFSGERKEAVDWYAAHGHRELKLYNSFRPEWVAPTTEYAHARGLRVGGHIPAFMRVGIPAN